MAVNTNPAGHALRCAKSRKYAKPLKSIAWLFCCTASAALGQDAANFYRGNCSACHTIGAGAVAGPDLKDVTQRQSREWLIHFLLDPEAVGASKDEYAKKLVADSNGMVMPKIEGVDRARAEALLAYIESESKGSPARSAGNEPIAETPFTADDVQRGKQVVLGSVPLVNGGPACISCHTLNGLAPLGGGRLGPDLTSSYDHLGGRRNLTGWLTSTPTPTMQAVYKTHPMTPEEVAALVAYLESAVTLPSAAPQTLPVGTFVLTGLGGSLVGLVLLDGFWRKRFRAVRRPLVARRRT